MKAFIILSAIAASNFSTLMAKDLSPFEDNYVQKMNEDFKSTNFNQEMKLTYLTKLLEQQQKAYDEKIVYLENELHKTKERLIEKSLNQEKIEDGMKDRYNSEVLYLKKELAMKTKTIFEYQRQLEKIKPSEELKNVIKFNTELSAELRKTEDQLAFVQLKQVEGIRTGARAPASVKEGK